jgi:dihydroorotate dehydrogenase (NAD+) catalytic subunit
VPIIAIGGVQSPVEAQAMLAAGASAVGLATALLIDLRTPARIARELGGR